MPCRISIQTDDATGAEHDDQVKIGLVEQVARLEHDGLADDARSLMHQNRRTR